jgi:hypothetical protein
VVLYDGMTGDSHLFSEISAFVISALYQRPQALDGIFNSIPRSGNYTPPQSLLRDALSDILLQLERRGFVSSDTPTQNTGPY